MTRVAVPLSDRALSRLLRTIVVALAVGVPLFGALYVMDQRGGSGPSLPERQVQSAETQVRASPDNVALRIQLAQAYLQAKRLDDALHQYDEVLRVDRGQRTALMGRGQVLMTKGDLAGAAATYRTIISAGGGGEFAGADPQLEEAHYYLAVIADRQGVLRDAVTEAQAALKIDSTDADAWYLLGSVQLKGGAADAAVQAFRKAVSFVPTGWCDPYSQLAAAYTKLARTAQAEYAGAMVDFCQHQPARAATRLQALVTGPAAVDAMLGLGMVAESTSDRAGAARWYQRVLATDARNASALTGLARLGTPQPHGSGTPKPQGG
jgi:tetratricopeptide (TPR) repeat protein